MRELERDAMPKVIGAAPNNAKRAQSRLVEDLKRIKVLINGLSPFKVQNGGQNTLLKAMFQFVNGTHNFDLSLRFPFKPKETSSHRDSLLLSVAGIKGG